MGIWKIESNTPVRVSQTKLKDEKLLEQHLEDWVATDTDLLGEPLLIIGRQVIIPEVKDRLDLLALDPQGNAVIVELKRGKLSDPVDMQALRYASYISRWKYEDFENQAKAGINVAGDSEFNFNQEYEQFCSDAGVDEVPDLNGDQRIIIVGSEVRNRLGSVALWLREHNVDIKVIEMQLFRDGENVFVEPHTIIPLPVSRFINTGAPKKSPSNRPWLGDGKEWHLEKRCGPKSKEMLLELNSAILDNFEVDGPRWNQKFYVAYRVNNSNWLVVDTNASLLRLKFLVKAGTFKVETLAKQLGVEVYDTDESLSEKLAMPSSVRVNNLSEATDRVNLRIKEGFDITSTSFMTFLKQAYKVYPK